MIQKEEPKQELFANGERVYLKEDNNVSQVVDDNTKDWSLWERLPKQETLEEVAEDYAVQFLLEDEQETDSANRKQAFKAGAKWQAERMYSEEDVDRLISIIEWYDNESDVRPDSEFMWFEQFKKK